MEMIGVFILLVNSILSISVVGILSFIFIKYSKKRFPGFIDFYYLGLSAVFAAPWLYFLYKTMILLAL